MDILKLRGIFLFIFAFCLLILALILWQRAKKDKAKFWLGLSSLFSAFYAFFCGGTYFFWEVSSIASVYWYRTTWLGVLLLPPFVIFTYYFTKNFKWLKIKAFLLYLSAIIISYLSLTTNLFVRSVYLKHSNISSLAGELDFVGRLYILFCVLIVLINLLREFFRSTGFRKLQLQYFILGIILFAVTGIITTSVVPFIIGESPYYDVTAYASFVWMGLTAYAILRYRLFDIKVILTQLVVFALWITTLVRLFLSKGWQEVLINGGFLVFLVIFGILLIRSVLKEVEQREKLEALTKNLEAANEKLKTLDRLKSEFLSFASHQVKSPMSIVKGYATLIFDGTLGPVSNEIKDIAKKIKNSADRLIGLVNNLLDLRKIEEGKMEFNFEKINVVEVVKNLVEEFKQLAKDKNLELTFESEKDEIKINLDVQKFSQVIQNLIDNAIKYTEKGGVKVSITNGKERGAKSEGQMTKDYVLITVADSGRGISKELASKLFEQFSRDASVKKEIQGTGLGLYIAKQIVLAHQGEIWAESEGEGKGSKFMVKLPVVGE